MNYTLTRPGIYCEVVGENTNAAIQVTLYAIDFDDLENVVYDYTVTLVNANTGMDVYHEVGSIPRPELDPYIINIPLRLFYDVETIVVMIQANAIYDATANSATIAELCENTKALRHSAVTSFKEDTTYAYLKAFCNMPGSAFSDVFVCWEKSTDGFAWEEYLSPTFSENISKVKCSVVDTAQTLEKEDEDLENSTSPVYVLRTAFRLAPVGVEDLVEDRPDVIRTARESKLDNALYRIRMFTVKSVTSGDSAYIEGADYTVNLDLGTAVYTPVFSQQPEILVSDVQNVSNSRSVYYGNVLYGIGNAEFNNYLIASFPGETVRPMSRITPLDTVSTAHVTSVTPWKEFLIVSTDKSIHLVSSVEDGYTSSTVNTFIGIPDEDFQCAKSTLNGIIFKSGNTLYMLYPNVYAGTDSILNLTEISKPVEHILELYSASCVHEPFAIGTDSEYILMLPQATQTACLRYSYNDRIWTFCTYPVVFTNYTALSVSDIHMFGYTVVDGVITYGEYVLDASYDTLQNDVSEAIPYTDCVQPIASFKSYLEDCSTLDDALQAAIGVMFIPVHFELDSGQKSDSVGVPKQFVESKFNITTLHDKDCFPMNVTVHVDGMPHVVTRDVNTDSAFWKTTSSCIGTVSTMFTSNDSEVFNTFRQMYLRYSGRGRSIRHIVEGSSLYPFKIYDINYRYRNLNIKH